MTHKFARRIQMDLKRFNESPPPGIFIQCDKADITHIQVLIFGPKNTPYEDGFFYFDYRMPDNYPHSPPKVILITTANGEVRFNPNLYSCGKVCLSILGTWSGPSWTSVLSLSTVLLSIQSLLCDNPFYNEPGRVENSSKNESDSYNVKTQYHTLKHAVGDILDKKAILPDDLYEISKEYFLNNFDNYMTLCDKNTKYDGTSANDGFNGQIRVNFTQERERLTNIRNSLL